MKQSFIISRLYSGDTTYFQRLDVEWIFNIRENQALKMETYEEAVAQIGVIIADRNRSYVPGFFQVQTIFHS